MCEMTRFTLDNLASVKGQAELIGGRIVSLPPAGLQPTRIVKRILLTLDAHVERLSVGEAFGSTLGYAIRPPLPNGRESFSPDASYYTGNSPEDGVGFLQGPPVFAAEVRSENDYGPTADREYSDKRADYFLAGTLVVWDVDPLAETVACYRSTDPLTPVIFRRGDTAEAEPAVPGWRLSVDELFGPRPAAN